MSGEIIETTGSSNGIREMLLNAGYSDKAIQYYLEKPYMGTLPDADQVSEMTGTCGDTMAVYLKVAHGKVTDVMYQVTDCAVPYPPLWRPWIWSRGKKSKMR